MANLLYVYTRSYLAYCMKSNDMSTFDQTVEEIFLMLDQVHLFITTKLGELFSAVKDEDLDADEQQAEFEGLVE